MLTIPEAAHRRSKFLHTLHEFGHIGSKRAVFPEALIKRKRRLQASHKTLNLLRSKLFVLRGRGPFGESFAPNLHGFQFLGEERYIGFDALHFQIKRRGDVSGDARLGLDVSQRLYQGIQICTALKMNMRFPSPTLDRCSF